MDPHLLQIIDQMVHQLYMIDLRNELQRQCDFARRCRIWIETMMFTRHWTDLLQRDIIYRVILSAPLNPVHRQCYDRLLFLTRLTLSLQNISPVLVSKQYSYNTIPILLL